MAKEHPLSEYGPERRDQGNRATNGGQQECKPIPYSQPVGPKDQHRNRVGLGGETHHCGTQGKH